MDRYVLKRFLMLFPVLLGIFLLVFVLMRVVPGDPVTLVSGPDVPPETILLIKKDLGLDKPLYIQFIYYAREVFRGNLGRSIRTHRSVINEIKLPFINTIKLTVSSMVLAILLGILAGVLSSLYQHSKIDYTCMVLAILGVSTPSFYLGILLILFFSIKLHWLPSGGMNGWEHLILPSITLAAASTAVIARMTRSSMLEVISQEYIVATRAKGVSEWKVIMKHALKNALIPIITVVGLQTGSLLGGAIFVEYVFSYPGIGWMMVEAISMRDYPVVQGGVLLVASTFVFVNLFTDLIYPLIDRRIKY